jgi:hypothetical protein
MTLTESIKSIVENEVEHDGGIVYMDNADYLTDKIIATFYKFAKENHWRKLSYHNVGMDTQYSNVHPLTVEDFK